MKPEVGQTIRFRENVGKVLAFYEEDGHYNLNIECNFDIDSWTYLNEEDLKEILIIS